MQPARTDDEELGDDLYQEFLLDHYQNPRNAGIIDPAEIRHDGDNPTCGDMVLVSARVDAKGAVSDIKFQGKGCAISQASASILYEDVKGKTLEEILEMGFSDVQDLIGIEIRPARVKCADLGLVALKEGIKEYKSRGHAKKSLPGF